jgi:hypothetical protein
VGLRRFLMLRGGVAPKRDVVPVVAAAADQRSAWERVVAVVFK